MTMQSSNLLPALQELPGGEPGQQRPFREIITGLVNMDRAMYAAESAAAVSVGMWAVFPSVNVDDNLFEVYRQAYPSVAADHSLHDHWASMTESGDASMMGFINGLKGMLAEMNAVKTLEQNEFTNITIVANPTQSLWDISAINEVGETVFFQVKTGSVDYVGATQAEMAANPDIHFAVGSEIYQQIVGPELDIVNRMRDIGSNELLTEEVRQNLNTLVNDPENLDDSVHETMTRAHEMAFKDVAQSQTLPERWQEIIERGDVSMENFISPLKGKIAEINFAEQLKETGSTVSIHPNPTHSVSDITEITPDGVTRLWQVKSYAEDNAYKVEDLMGDNPDINYAVSTEVYNQIAEPALDTVNRITDIGPDHLLVDGIEDGLNTLSNNIGIDVPDGIGDILPYAGAIIAGARLVHSVIKTEKEFKAADRTTRNKIQVVQSLTVMSRLGVTTVMSTAGGMAGTAAGSVLPGPGNLIGGIVGAIGGAGIGMYLNKHLQPHMLNLALDITGLTNDDLFYYKNKPRIDDVALNFRKIAGALAAVPAH